ncbi:MAG: hypothetical protein JWP58_3913 [Hymenobacter sp.]|nr:hypothetical protein [Hymenobacter sp.]
MRILKSFFWPIPGAILLGQFIGWLLVLFVLALLSSCSREVWRAPMAPDTTGLLLPGLPVGGKYKFTGPVTFTVATAPGAVATSTSTSTDNRKAGQRGGAAATAPDAVATATTKKAGVPWWVFVLMALAGAALLAWLQSKFSFLSFLKR